MSSPTEHSEVSDATVPSRRLSALFASATRTGAQVRKEARQGLFTSTTSGEAPSHLQANLIILPSCYADDFTRLCKRNPVPCPLIAKSAKIGSYDVLESWIEGLTGEELARDLDIRTDAPKYMVYENGVLIHEKIIDIQQFWTNDHVAFLIGCSFSFEEALSAGGLVPRHTKQLRNVPMYKTNIPLCPSGVFNQGTYVVSMRPYRREQIESAREITRPYLATHGEPIAWGWNALAELGIKNFNTPEWGDPPLNECGLPFVEIPYGVGSEDGGQYVPVFWGCGVTPQDAVKSANLEGVIMGHAPGHMLVLDCRDDDIFRN